MVQEEETMSPLVWGVDRAPGKPIRRGDPKLSADRRRTLVRQDSLARGIHPTTGRPLLDAEWGFTCRDCDHCCCHRRNKTYWKCDAVELTLGPGSDIRLSWPACASFRMSAEPRVDR